MADSNTLPTTFPSEYVHPQTVGQGGDPFRVSHPSVDNYVDRFQTDLRGFFSGALMRSGRYVPRMMTILEKEGVPTELVYLPLIESGFRTQAVSPAGAVGPWQFIPGTGRRYGLRIDRYVDERRDPVKSTRAAARYLRALHDMFGDWHLSLAAYNTGEGRISRILDSGLADDYWEMSDNGYLVSETERYVPEFLAAVQICENPEAHGFESPEMAAIQYDIISLKSSIQLSTIARLTNSSLDEIKELNPALHRGMVPPEGYVVRLPKGTKELFQTALVQYEDEMRELAERRRAEMQARASACRGKGKRCNLRVKSVGSGRAMVASSGSRSSKTVTSNKPAAPAKSVKVASNKRGDAASVKVLIGGQAVSSKAQVAKVSMKSATPSKTTSARKASPAQAARTSQKIVQKKTAPIVTASRKGGRKVVD